MYTFVCSHEKMSINQLQKVKQRFGIVGNAPALNRAIELAIRIAATNIGVLIIGENGSGKESFAKIIHYLSHRKHGPFIAINCGAIPEGTIDSELFGHEKGSFTDASITRKGYFEEADQGSIFLDEIGEMPLHTQPRLLRVLENREYLRVGSSQKRSTNARMIAATNVNLQQYVQQKKFREDLYYRIAQVQITIPPLRERAEDIDLLFRKFALEYAQINQQDLIKLTAQAKEMLRQYPFPGNVRQLKNITWQLATLEEPQSNITQETLAKYLPSPITLPTLSRKTLFVPNKAEKETFYKVIFEMKEEIQEIKKVFFDLIQKQILDRSLLQEHPHLFRMLWNSNPTAYQKSNPQKAIAAKISSPPKEEASHDTPTQEDLSLKNLEKRLITKAVEKAPNYKEAAKMLGISERTLFRKVHQYKIKRSSSLKHTTAK